MMTKTLIKSIALALAGAGVALAANANTPEETFDVTFQFSRTQPVQEVYADFQSVAKRACRPDNYITVMRYPARMVAVCESELMDLAVAKSGFPALAAHHRLHTRTEAASGKTSDR